MRTHWFYLLLLVTIQTYPMEHDQAVGALFAIPIALYIDQATLDQTCEIINRHHIGTVLLDKKGTIAQQAFIINTLLRSCSPPPMIMQDLEWGLTMRLTDGLRFPRAMTCGAIQDNTLITRMAQEIARQAQLIGVDMVLAPVADVNSNPENPIIGNRSFGQDPELVFQKAAAYLDGLHRAGITGCGKHFPGHGDTSLDSHLALPTVNRPLSQLTTVELYPFTKLIQTGIDCIMTAHILVPALDTKPATLSYAITTQLLKNTLHFDGVVIADALRMQALTDHNDSATIALQAYKAGCDLLLCPPDLTSSIESFKTALNTGDISPEELYARAHKIQRLRTQRAVDAKKPINLATVYDQLVTPSARELKKELYQAAITLVRNQSDLLPLTNPQKVAVIHYGNEPGTSTQDHWLDSLHKQFPALPVYHLPSAATGMDANELLDQLMAYDTIIVGIFDPQAGAYASTGLNPALLALVNQLQKTKRMITVLFCSPYHLKLFANSDAIVQAYEDDEDAQHAAAQVITGQLKPTGRLSVSAGESFPIETGLTL